MDLWQFLGTLHPKLVQFPLVLLLVGLLFDLVGLIANSARARWAGLISTGIGTVSLLFAFICGIYAEVWAGRAGVPQHPIELHELVANIASWGFVILFAWRILLSNSDVLTTKARRWLTVYVCAGLAWYLLLALTGYLGGQLVFQYGAGVTAAQNGVLSLHDLNALATRQTDKNLWYSEWMHHIFGFLTLGLAVSLLAQAIWPAQRKRLAWIVPAFLIGGGLFLFFMADLDLYPRFTDPRQWRDREVQLHKVIALTMTTIGCVGMWRLFSKKAAASESTTAAPTSNNSKLIAIMALIGGSMLFTHIHTVAPYANVAAGVYIAHVIMGFVALAIGGARLAQEYLPRWRGALAVVFALFMLVESGLLITYNEGLPWFIGYGTYRRWFTKEENWPADKRDEILPEERFFTVAPFGSFRAILNVNQKDGKLHVAFRKSIPPPAPAGNSTLADDSVTLTFDAPPQLLISHGSGEIALPLAKSVNEGAPPEPPEKQLIGSNFGAQAEFIKTAAYLNARLLVSINGRQEVGYFDPWVTPRVVPVPPNEVAKYECPMHEGIRSKDEGVCPICHMPLVAIRPPLPAGQLHDDRYSLDVALAEGDRQKPLSTTLLLQFKDQSKPAPIVPTHGQPMHLIMVSGDLKYFDHVHPTELPTSDGRPQTFQLPYTFPREGTYYLFSDVTPKGDRSQFFSLQLVAKADGVVLPQHPDTKTLVLTPDAGSKFLMPLPAPRTPQESSPLDLSVPPPLLPIPGIQPVGPMVKAMPQPVLVELLTQPRTLYAGIESQLQFRLSDPERRPLTDLTPYLQAQGHCVIISEDMQVFLHCHPEDIMGTPPDWRGGPNIAFGVTFPKAGRYRVWAQFQRDDQLIIAPFTIEVKDAPIPPSLIRFLLNE